MRILLYVVYFVTFYTVNCMNHNSDYKNDADQCQNAILNNNISAFNQHFENIKSIAETSKINNNFSSDELLDVKYELLRYSIRNSKIFSILIDSLTDEEAAIAFSKPIDGGGNNLLHLAIHNTYSSANNDEILQKILNHRLAKEALTKPGYGNYLPVESALEHNVSKDLLKQMIKSTGVCLFTSLSEKIQYKQTTIMDLLLKNISEAKEQSEIDDNIEIFNTFLSTFSDIKTDDYETWEMLNTEINSYRRTINNIFL